MKPLPTTADARLEVDGRVAVLTLDRDDIRNALTGSALIDDIVATVEWANAEPGISALVLTGSGRAFSSGGNVKDMYARTADFAGEVAEVEARYRAGIVHVTSDVTFTQIAREYGTVANVFRNSGAPAK